MTVPPDHGSVGEVSFATVSLRDSLSIPTIRQWPLEKAQCLLDLRRILTPPQESPDSGAPRRSNQNQSHRCSLSGWSVLLLDSQASEGSPPVEPGSDEHQGDRRQSGRQRVGNIHASSCKRVATHRNAKTVGCRRDCDEPHTLPRLKLCPGLSAERERTPGPFRRSAPLTRLNPGPSQPREVGHSAARAGGAAAPAGTPAGAAAPLVPLPALPVELVTEVPEPLWRLVRSVWIAV